MLKRLAAAALIALFSTVAPPVMAKDKPPTSAAQTKAKKPPQAGMVWVTESTGIYHRKGSPYYGKTANGKWMKEMQARALGYHLSGSPGNAKTGKGR